MPRIDLRAAGARCILPRRHFALPVPMPSPSPFDRRRCGVAAAIVFAVVCPWVAAQPLTWDGRIGLASDWVVRGLRLSDGRAPVTSAGVDAYTASGWSIGVAAARLRDPRGQWSEAWSLHAGRDLPLDANWLVLADIRHIRYSHSRSLEGWSGTQLALGLARGDQWSLTWNAEQPRDPRLATRSLDFNLRWPLVPQVGLTAGLGRVVHAPGERYGYGQVGLEGRAGPARLRLDRSWTGSAAASSYGGIAVQRWIASAQWTF